MQIKVVWKRSLWKSAIVHLFLNVTIFIYVSLLIMHFKECIKYFVVKYDTTIVFGIKILLRIVTDFKHQHFYKLFIHYYYYGYLDSKKN